MIKEKDKDKDNKIDKCFITNVPIIELRLISTIKLFSSNTAKIKIISKNTFKQKIALKSFNFSYLCTQP